MKVLFHSRRWEEETKYGWFRGGNDICYYPSSSKNQNLFTLSFNFQVPYDKDEIFISHWYPYTYSDLRKFVNEVEARPAILDICRITSLGKSLAGNNINMFIISNFNSSEMEISEWKAVIVTSRVHPGESNSSFIVQGMIQFMLQDDEVAIALRNWYVFKFVPMLNPDGVILGNYWASLSGNDLNWQWQVATTWVYPEISMLKGMLKKTIESRMIEIYIDLHGHSWKSNTFIYGNNVNSRGQSNKNQEKIFPFLMSKVCKYFEFSDCNFKV